jgi:hypothetical protein
MSEAKAQRKARLDMKAVRGKRAITVNCEELTVTPEQAAEFVVSARRIARVDVVEKGLIVYYGIATEIDRVKETVYQRLTDHIRPSA